MKRLLKMRSLFTRHSEVALIGALETQLGTVLQGAHIASSVADGTAELGAARLEMEAVEKRGDERRAELVEMLSQTLTTPIDREDMFRLSRAIDDILNSLRDFVRESDLYDVGDQSRLSPALEDVVEGISELQAAVRMMAQHPDGVVEHALAARKAGNAVCRKYQYEVAYLFRDEMSAMAMKSRELTRRLDIAGERISEASDTLADAVMKRWH
jgi:uncharacterized protein Yka (UPF0111/DUF47 family)